MLGSVNGAIGLAGVNVLPTSSLGGFGSLATSFPITLVVENANPGEILQTVFGIGADNLRDKGFENYGANQSSFILIGHDRLLLISQELSVDGADVQIIEIDQATGEITKPKAVGTTEYIKDDEIIGAEKARKASFDLSLADGQPIRVEAMTMPGEDVSLNVLAVEQSALAAELSQIANARQTEMAMLANAFQ